MYDTEYTHSLILRRMNLEAETLFRLQDTGISGLQQNDTVCCYARFGKYWTRDPQGIAREVFHILVSIPTFYEQDAAEAPASGGCVPAIPGSSYC